MKRLTYTVEIRPGDPDESGFWVSVPALPGCFTQGETYEEAILNAEEAIIGHVEALMKEGLPVPQESSPSQTVLVGVTVSIAA